ncbi:MAG: hypothetical protein HY689_10710, partial [Chloroflexi bacterium]|nr:hypothetical protein [Chloroflexota bacterium]
EHAAADPDAVYPAPDLDPNPDRYPYPDTAEPVGNAHSRGTSVNGHPLVTAGDAHAGAVPGGDAHRIDRDPGGRSDPDTRADARR